MNSFHRVIAQLGDEAAERAENRRRTRNKDTVDTDLRSEKRSLDGPSSTIDEQREFLRVHALPGEIGQHAGNHVRAGDSHAHLGGRRHIGSECLGDRCHGLLGRIEIEMHRAAKQRFREVTRQQIGIGERRCGASTPEACRTGERASALWPDTQHAPVEGGDGAAARADRLDPGDGHDHRKIANFRGRRRQRFTVAHQRNIRAGTPHVHGEDVVLADRATKILDRRDARCGAGQKGMYGEGARFGRRHRSPVGPGDEKLRSRQPRRNVAFHRADIRIHAAAHECIEDTDGCPLIFADTRPDFARQTDFGVFADDTPDRAFDDCLMVRIGVAMEKRDRKPRSAGLHGLSREGLDRLFIDGRLDGAAPKEPFLDLEDHGTVNQRLGAVLENIERVAHSHALEFKQISIALRHEERDFRTLPLDHRIRADGRPVHHQCGLAVFRAKAFKQALKPLFESILKVWWRGGDFKTGDVLLTFTPSTEVGECTADVDADSKHNLLFSPQAKGQVASQQFKGSRL
ncbi:hypothetical protein CHELA40_11353 [Chelatococcus asaccharovorans]|nr:hypothetical protein CHELA40_11353 [Chelatococcus asaccharovorans]CAH1684933.1 hypothetical protein CHELA17_64247 [Chelatococcus asaccharovorans]